MKKMLVGVTVLFVITVTGFVYAQNCGVASSRQAGQGWVIGKCANGQDLNCSWDKRQKAWNCNGQVHTDINVAANAACCR